MATICYTCGWCRKLTASAPINSQMSEEHEDEIAVTFLCVQVVLKCGTCKKISIAETYEYMSGAEGDPERARWERKLKSDSVLSEDFTRQNPSLLRECPDGVESHHISRAWYEAERAFSVRHLSTPAGMAYRRVIDVAIREMTNDDKSRTPLGVRVKKLLTEGRISAELAELIDKAKAFGDEAAHGTPLREKDAAIARDLCEAFLRQAFTIPHLTAQIRTAIAEREAEENQPEVPF